MKRCLLLILFSVIELARLSAQDATIVEKIRTLYLAERPDTALRNSFDIKIEPVSILDSASWSGVYATYFLDKEDTSAAPRCMAYFIFDAGQVHFALYKHPRNRSGNVPNRMYRKLTRKYGQSKIAQIEHYFYYQYPGNF